MAKAKQEEKPQNSMAAASEELSKLLIKLYKSKSFTHAGKSLADMLFKSGIEAGSLISGITQLTERKAKINAANQAILQLNQTAYIANVMEKADFYRASQVKPLTDYVKQVIDALRELLISVPEPVKKIHIQSTQPVVQFAQVNVTSPNQVETEKPAEVEAQASPVLPENKEELEQVAADITEEEGDEQLAFQFDDEPVFDDDDGFGDPMPLIE